MEMTQQEQAPGCNIMASNRWSARGRGGHGYQRLQRPYSNESIEMGTGNAHSTAAVDAGVAGIDSSKSKAGSSSVAPKGHPLLNFMQLSRKKKRAKVKPELVRYLAYVKEMGTWDATSGRPVIYYK